jgi:hypothetical protein
MNSGKRGITSRMAKLGDKPMRSEPLSSPVPRAALKVVGACLGQGQGAGCADEQRGADLVLEVGDDARDRRLGQAPFTAGSGEAAGAGDAREQLKGGDTISHLKYKYIISICSGYCAKLR